MNAPSAVTGKTMRRRRRGAASTAGSGRDVVVCHAPCTVRGLRSIMQLTRIRAWNARALPAWTARLRSASMSSANGGACSSFATRFSGSRVSTSSSAGSGSRATSSRSGSTRLVDAGVLGAMPYSAHPPRHDYRLTDKGRDLWPVITAMRQWGDRYAAPNGPPLEVVHTGCGAVAHGVFVCSSCGEPIGARDVTPIPGHGRKHANIIPQHTARAS